MLAAGKYIQQQCGSASPGCIRILTVTGMLCSRMSDSPWVPLQAGGYTNEPPYCAELYNARSLPYGFRSYDLRNLFGNGFPVWFDINLSQEDATRFFEYVQGGLYYDSNTR